MQGSPIRACGDAHHCVSDLAEIIGAQRRETDGGFETWARGTCRQPPMHIWKLPIQQHADRQATYSVLVACRYRQQQPEMGLTTLVLALDDVQSVPRGAHVESTYPYHLSRWQSRGEEDLG